VVVSFAKGCAIALEKVPCAQLLVAMVASEMLRVPGLSKCRDDLSNNWLVAGAAAALLHCVHSLTRHVRLETAKHILKLVLPWSGLVEGCLYDGFFACLVVGDALRWLCVVGDGLLLMLLL
jgi:hypothetical protein